MDPVPPTNSPDETAECLAFIRGLPRQRLVVRTADEIRPRPGEGTGVVVDRVRWVEVVTVSNGRLDQRRFHGVAGPAALEAARAAGHDVVERSGNVT